MLDPDEDLIEAYLIDDWWWNAVLQKLQKKQTVAKMFIKNSEQARRISETGEKVFIDIKNHFTLISNKELIYNCIKKVL